MTLAIDELHLQVSRELAVSDWLLMSQARIDAFAEATGDHQWLHTDPVRARAESPFGTTVAHGFLTLAVVPMLIRNSIAVTGARLSVNYGLNRVRFIAPVPAESNIRARFTLAAVDDRGDSLQATWHITIERDGSDRPCAAIESLTRYYRGSATSPAGGVEEHA